MTSCYIGFVLFLFIVALVNNVNAFASYKWVSLKLGDPLPENIVPLKESNDAFVGRTNYKNEILPIKIHANGTIFLLTDFKAISTDTFEILTSTDGCEWLQASRIEEYGGNLVRVGTTLDGQPTFVGYSLLIRKNQLRIYYNVWVSEMTQYLSCKISKKWMTFLQNMTDLPNNIVSGGTTENGQEICIARWKSKDAVEAFRHIGEFIMQKNDTAIAFLDEATESRVFDVLIGEPNQYSWVPAGNGVIPDYAIQENVMQYEPAYVGRINKAITTLTVWRAIRESNYEILVINQPITAKEKYYYSYCSECGSQATDSTSTSSGVKSGISFIFIFLVSISKVML